MCRGAARSRSTCDDAAKGAGVTKPRIRASVAAVAAASSPNALVTVDAKPAPAAEAYTAGSRSHPDLRRWQPVLGSADSDLLPERGTIVSRARDLERNHGVADGARQTYHDNIVGCGLRLSAKPNLRVLGWTADQAEEWGNTVEAWWSTFWESRTVDVAGLLTGDGLTSQAFNSVFSNGDAVALPLWMPERGLRFSTCVQMIDPDRLSNPDGEPNSDRLRDGIEKDRHGRPVAGWFRNAHPGEFFFKQRLGAESGLARWTRVPWYTPHGRLRVIHAFAPLRSSQSRGVPALTSVMRQFKVLGDLTNAELKAAVVNAMVAMFTEVALDQEGIVELLSSDPESVKKYQESIAERSSSAIEFTGGRIIPLRPGEKISSFAPQRPNTSFESFVTLLFRLIGVGAHIPYELLMKDFSKTNYSSARAALLEVWRFFRGKRKWLATSWMAPIYRLWLEEVVDQGLIEAPDFYENWEAYCAADWIGDGRGWVDPLKEVEAAALRMSLGISTLEDECNEQGADWRAKLTQIARELKFKKKLEAEHGITFPAARPSAPAAAFQTDDPEKPGGAGGDKAGDQGGKTDKNASGAAAAALPA